MFDYIFTRGAEDTCAEIHDDHIDNLGVRISSVFVIFALSSLGSMFPLVSRRYTKLQVPSWVFFICRYFGSGVILATGFIHLLADASETLTEPCLGGTFEEYPWAEAIALIAVFLVFTFDSIAHKRLHDQEKPQGQIVLVNTQDSNPSKSSVFLLNQTTVSENSSVEQHCDEISKSKMLNCVILECGIVLHSIFIGLSLAVSDDEFVSLYIALCFHQFFEGLGLGTRFAGVMWPQKYHFVPWFMAFVFSLSTPLAVAAGLGARKSFSIGSRNGLIVSGIFDSACAGILLYNSIAELMAYDFIYSDEFHNKNTKVLLSAIFMVGLGALAMAILGKWA
ncbi:hypothetical protein G210_5129 [Candida maltosa Xu316]|uniref:Uncharacterized protein n=1 Tax=Candida maltosa (strain Xu316) TaxID=1245528 RepID=M3ITK5_CANMX|nr:hypothetical protein G210_5129 [Candida maltosa Xu316]